MSWRHYFGAGRAVCSLAVRSVAEDLERAGALVEGARDLWERGAASADRELHERGADAFPFWEYFDESRRLLELVTALGRDVEQLRRDRSRQRASWCARLN